jgi:hypothetical protein
MLELFKFFLKKIDFLAIAEMLRKRKNRMVAARLHLILVKSYEIIELYRVLLDELKTALASHQRAEDRHHFSLHPDRIIYLLELQASNLEVMETLTFDLMHELQILDHKFAEAYRELLPSKFGILFEAQGLLAGGRLSLVESGPQYFPADVYGEYRTLWFTSDAPQQDRREVEKYLYGWSGEEKTIIDVNVHDGDAFFHELNRYWEKEDPEKRLQEIEELTEKYKDVLLQNFSIEDILSDIGKLRRYQSWAK